jgi:hypothetical protein
VCHELDWVELEDVVTLLPFISPEKGAWTSPFSQQNASVDLVAKCDRVGRGEQLCDVEVRDKEISGQGLCQAASA